MIAQGSSVEIQYMISTCTRQQENYITCTVHSTCISGNFMRHFSHEKLQIQYVPIRYINLFPLIPPPIISAHLIRTILLPSSSSHQPFTSNHSHLLPAREVIRAHYFSYDHSSPRLRIIACARIVTMSTHPSPQDEVYASQATDTVTLDQRIQELTKQVEHCQILLGNSQRLHLLLEKDCSQGTSEQIETCVLFSPTIKMDCSLNEVGIQLAHILYRQKMRAMASVPLENIEPVSPVPQRTGGDEGSQEPQPVSNNDCARTCEEFVIPSWFPGSPRRESDCSLKVSDEAMTLFSEFDERGIASIYFRFFKNMFNKIVTLDEANNKNLRKNGWVGRFAYADFTPPWLRKQSTYGAKTMYIGSKHLTAIPHAKNLRNHTGRLQMKRILALFYTYEEPCRAILWPIMLETPRCTEEEIRSQKRQRVNDDDTEEVMNLVDQ